MATFKSRTNWGKVGTLMSSLDGFIMNINSKEPPDDHKMISGTDATRISAYFLTGIKELMFGRSLSDDHPVSVSFGKICGGNLPNHFAVSTVLEGTL